LLRMIKRLWELPPREAFHKLERKLTGQRGTFDIEEIIQSPNLMRGQRSYDFLSRYEAILARTSNWQPLQFKGKRVLELGSGPLLGFAPVALAQGAESYSAIEPTYDSCVLEEPRIVEQYYLNAFRDLCAIYGLEQTFGDFMKSLKDRTVAVSETLANTSLEGPFDIVLSNSCLEHVFDFENAITKLRKICAPECRFIHLVNYSNHRPTKSPFQDLYAMSPEDYLKQYDDEINLLRVSDMTQIFASVGFEAEMIPYYQAREHFEGPIHPHWAEKYDDNVLFTKAAIICSK
jgi:SAM-dependent methyltransferase